MWTDRQIPTWTKELTVFVLTCSSEMLICAYKITRHCYPNDQHRPLCLRENSKSQQLQQQQQKKQEKQLSVQQGEWTWEKPKLLQKANVLPL